MCFTETRFLIVQHVCHFVGVLFTPVGAVSISIVCVSLTVALSVQVSDHVSVYIFLCFSDSIRPINYVNNYNVFRRVVTSDLILMNGGRLQPHSSDDVEVAVAGRTTATWTPRLDDSMDDSYQMN